VALPLAYGSARITGRKVLPGGVMSAPNYLLKYGRAVVKNGWPIVLLPHGQKVPVQKGWQNKTLSYHDIEGLINSGKRYGIGIQCGNLVGIDDDYEIEGVVTKEFRKAMNEVKDHYFPDALERLGRETRSPLRVIKLDDKAQAKSLNIGKLQILGKGRQFVAYNIHPDTDQPYRWKKEHSPASVDIREVPSFPVRLLNNFIKAVRILEETFGLDPGKAGETVERIKEGDLEQGELKGDESLMRHAVGYLQNDDLDWDNWKRLLMALYNASGGKEWGRELAHVFSEKSDKYDEEATNKEWDAMDRSPPDRIGAGTILWEAKQNPDYEAIKPKEFNDVIFIKNSGRIMSMKSGKDMMDRGTFNDVYVEIKSKGKTPLATFIHNYPEQVYESETWDPTLPFGPNIDKHGYRVYNFCKFPEWFGEEGNIEPWMTLMTELFKEHVDTVIKRMAFDVQYPQLRPQWHMLVVGRHRIGKNAYSMPLDRWYDQHGMRQAPTAKSITKDFNRFMSRAKVIFVNELDEIGNSDFNALKDFMAGSTTEVVINPKYGKQYSEKFVGSWYFTSNEVAPISISITEERLFVLHVDRLAPKDRETRRFAWLEKNWPRVIWHLKHKVEVEPNYGARIPYITEDQKTMASITSRNYEQLSLVVKKELSGMAYFKIGDLQSCILDSDYVPSRGESVTVKSLSMALSRLQAKPFNKGKPVRLDGKLTRLWAVNTEYAKKSLGEMRKLVDVLGTEFRKREKENV
jgi:hypothetical protein